jgi:signal transduction histidine kinase
LLGDADAAAREGSQASITETAILPAWFGGRLPDWGELSRRIELVAVERAVWDEWLGRLRTARALARCAEDWTAQHLPSAKKVAAAYAYRSVALAVRWSDKRVVQLWDADDGSDRCLDDGSLALAPEISSQLQRAIRSIRSDQVELERWSDTPANARADVELPALRELFSKLVSRLARLEELETEFQTALQHEKLLSLKELAYGASHEINNPLANIASRAQLLLRGEKDPQRCKSLATIHSQALRAHEMIADMMLFAKPPAPQLNRLDLSAWLRCALDELARHLPPAVCLHRQLDEELGHLDADATQLTVALGAIWTNALQAMGTSGTLRVTSRRESSDVCGIDKWAKIEIQDSGPGISAHVRRHLFDPFFSGREAGRGLGFGLSKAWTIIRQHQGTIVVDSPASGGTSLTIRLPISR